MSKEEILYPLHTHCDEELEMIYTHESAMKAMDIYSKQECIDMISFIRANSFPASSDMTDEFIYEMYKEAMDE